MWVNVCTFTFQNSDSQVGQSGSEAIFNWELSTTHAPPSPHHTLQRCWRLACNLHGPCEHWHNNRDQTVVPEMGSMTHCFFKTVSRRKLVLSLLLATKTSESENTSVESWSWWEPLLRLGPWVPGRPHLGKYLNPLTCIFVTFCQYVIGQIVLK